MFDKSYVRINDKCSLLSIMFVLCSSPSHSGSWEKVSKARDYKSGKIDWDLQNG